MSVENDKKNDVTIVETSIDELINNNSMELSTINEKDTSVSEDLKDLEENNEKSIKCVKSPKKEILILTKLAVPIAISEFLKYLTFIISNVFVGRIGSTELAGIALGYTFCSSTGWYVIIGFGTALDTLCSQAYTAAETKKDKKILGTIVQRSLAILFVICIPVAILWIFSEKIFLLLGQDKEAAVIGNEYCRIATLALIPYVLFDYLRKFVQTQGIVRPPSYIIALGTPVNILLHYFLINSDISPLSKEKRYLGAPITIVVVYWLLAIMMIIYIRFSKAKACWAKIDIKSAFTGWKSFFSLGIPGLLMVLSEALVYQLFSIVAGIMGTVELAAQSVQMSVSSGIFNALIGIATAACVRVGNLLGEGKNDMAKFSTRMTLTLSECISIVNGSLVIILRRQLAQIFSKEEDVIELASYLLILVGTYELADGIVTPGNGILRGCGRQKIGALMNLSVYWLCGVPAGLILAFVFHTNLFGIWISITVCLFALSILMIIIIRRINWKKECENAKERYENQKNKSNL